mgnify:CR=1 FL=1
MTKIKDNCILITGGASGIGRIMGRMALEKGARQLIIWDINEENLNATRNELAHLGKVACYKVNIADHAAVEQTFRQTTEECGAVDILINCAGVVTSNKTFEQLTLPDIERTMDINATAPMVIALQALPQMIERNHGHICNIASAAGMLSNPRMSVYAASKWAVIGWSDSVRIELKQMRSKVHFTTIAPYYINTGMFDGVKSPILPILEPETTARTIIRAIERNKDFKGIPLGFHLIRLAQGLLPTSWFEFIFGRCFGIFSTMDNFTGRKK